MSIFNFDNYRDIILDKIRANKSIRGYQSHMAHAMSAHSSYFSQVLKGTSHLTPDQASGLCDFWNLNEYECDYFINLVNYERCGTEGLRKRLKQKILDARHIAGDRIQVVDVEVSYKNAVQYYSNFHASLIQTALTVPSLQTAEALSSKLMISLDSVKNTLELLERMNFATKDGDQWKATKNSTSLDDCNREVLKTFFLSMRNKGLAEYETPKTNNAHLSIVINVTPESRKNIRSVLREAIQSIVEIAENNRGEELCGLNLDFFTF